MTQAKVRSLLSYDPLTGIFTWLCRSARRIRAGDVAGSVGPYGYRVIKIEGLNYQEHRLAHLYMTGSWPACVIDHIDGVRANNAWANLREATMTTNGQNMRTAHRDSATGLLGASPDGHRFISQIKVAGKVLKLGKFDTAEEAHQVYLAAKRRLHEGCTI
jgi:hypothetical protein